MRYWVYINDKVEGPFEEDKLVTLAGFTPDTLICTETTNGANQEWVKASTVFEFDPLESTITRALPTPEELNTGVNPAAGQTDPNLTKALKDAHAASQESAPAAQPANTDALALILAKLDSLTQEIEGLKTKMEEVITATSAVQAAQAAAPVQAPQTVREALGATPADDSGVNTITLTNRDMQSELHDDSIPSTETLTNHAEDVVAQGGTTEDKPLDFLQGMDLDMPETDNTPAPQPEAVAPAVEEKPAAAPAEISLSAQGEEEVVLRSALDSLYGASLQQEQSEKEKESTFQDLLNPNNLKKEPQKDEKPSAEEKEAIISQFAGKEHKDFIAEALAEAEKEEKAKEDDSSVKKAAAAAGLAAAGLAAGAALSAQDETPAQEVKEDLTPLTPEQEASIRTDLPQEPLNEVPTLPAGEEKPTLDMGEEAPSLAVAQEEQPQLQAVEPEPAPQETPAPQQVQAEPVQEQPQAAGALPGLAGLDADMGTPAQAETPAEQAAEEEKENTFQELVPGSQVGQNNAPINPNDAALINEEDLKHAAEPAADMPTEPVFSAPQAAVSTPEEAPQTIPSIGEMPEKSAAAPVMQEQEEKDDAPAELVPQTQTEEVKETTSVPSVEAAPEAEIPVQEAEKTTTQAEYSPNDLTEIELKEGSTYLISDFVPPAETKDFAAAAQAAMEKSKAELAATNTQSSTFIEEVVPAAKNKQPAELATEKAATEEKPATAEAAAAPAPENPVPGADVTVSQIILENTIKTKRGASLDLKTVPMVKDPADSQRLDLGDTELQDINTQHDVKSADFTPAAGKNKMLVLGGLLVVVLIAIYAGLAYLQLLPNSMNFINPKQARTQQAQTEQMNEMLPAAPAPQAAPQVNPTDAVLSEVKNYALPNGMTLEQLIAARHPNAGAMMEWSISTAVDPGNYSVMVKVPPENPQSFKLSYRFNYNTGTKTLEPTISDSKNLLQSAGVGQAAPMAQQAAQMPYQQAQANAAYNQPQPRQALVNPAANPQVAQQQRAYQQRAAQQNQAPRTAQRRAVQRPAR